MSPGVPGLDARTTANEDTLFYHKFSGEVQGFFQVKNLLTETRVRTMKVSGAKSQGFATYGQLIAKYHVPGTALLGNSAVGDRIPFGEVKIDTDNVAIVSQWINDLDKLKASYELRAPVARALGYALAHRSDYDRFASIIRAARMNGWHPDLQRDPTGNFTWGGQSGAVDSDSAPGASGINSAYQRTHNASLRGAALTNNAANLINAFLKIRQGFEERNAPEGEVFLAIQPAQYYMLLNVGAGVGPVAINRDWSPDNGSLAQGVVGSIAGMKLLVTQNLPKADHIAATATDNGKTKTGGNSYNGDFSNTLAVAWAPDAIGVLECQGITTDETYMQMYQAHLMLAKYCRGSNVLNPVLAAELWGSDTACTDAKLFPDT
jgi:hypothetical protein